MLTLHPRGNPKNPLTGVFATRSPVRPNLIALTSCRVLSVKGNLVEIDKIDAFTGSPIIDLKPYIPRIDWRADAKGPAWVDR
ncbi:MAG: SAM-dependent methyltransferase [Phycisphaerae bacterium]|nr:SAM-dependent methyltransferase [Phycisphaerae bacterium]